MNDGRPDECSAGEHKATGMGLRREVERLLRSDDFMEQLHVWSRFPARKVINPLLSFVYDLDDDIKGRAVTAIGLVMARMAHENMESARNIMRRLMWNLNDESGCSGWGSAEAMGEIMAVHEGLAREFYRILASYIRPEGNLLDNGPLERGVLWGLGRLAQTRPALVQGSAADLPPYLVSQDPYHRGLACRILCSIDSSSVQTSLRALLRDEAIVPIYEAGRVTRHMIKDLARQALKI